MLPHPSGRRVCAWVFVAALAGCGDATGPGNEDGALWVDLAVGQAHVCALDAAGAVYCWGSTRSGQAGQAFGPVLNPAPVTTPFSFASIEAGGDTTCGIATNERLYCWGSNAMGQLGDGSGQNSFEPVEVGGGLQWRQVSVGTYHVCGVDASSRVHCWGGDRWDVVLGYPATQECPAPFFEPTWPCSSGPFPSLSVGTFDWVEAGLYHNCVGTEGGPAQCWGTNDLGQLGATTTRQCLNNDPLHPTARPCSPAPVASEGPALARVKPGSTHSCGTTRGGDLYCFGGLALNYGQVGNGTLEGSAAPVAVAGGGPWREAFTSHGPHVRTFSCGIEESGRALCWGANRWGQLGSGPSPACGPAETPCRAEPTPVSGGHAFTTLGLGVEFACGLTADGAILCWGANGEGQLGDGTTDARDQPAPVVF